MSNTPKPRVESIVQFVSPGRREFFRTLLSAAAAGTAVLIPASELLAQNQGGGGKGKGNGGAKGKGKGNGNGNGNAADGAAKGKGKCKGKGDGGDT